MPVITHALRASKCRCAFFFRDSCSRTTRWLVHPPGCSRCPVRLLRSFERGVQTVQTVRTVRCALCFQSLIRTVRTVGSCARLSARNRDQPVPSSVRGTSVGDLDADLPQVRTRAFKAVPERLGTPGPSSIGPPNSVVGVLLKEVQEIGGGPLPFSKLDGSFLNGARHGVRFHAVLHRLPAVSGIRLLKATDWPQCGFGPSPTSRNRPCGLVLFAWCAGVLSDHGLQRRKERRNRGPRCLEFGHQFDLRATAGIGYRLKGSENGAVGEIGPLYDGDDAVDTDGALGFDGDFPLFLKKRREA